MKVHSKFSSLEIALLLVIVGVAALAYLYRLGDLRFFTYDQARDALFIKRIIVDHKLRLIGTQSSIPGLYTGPFYYYLMAPFLLVFNLNPIGLDFATALFNLFSIGLLFWLLKEETRNTFLSLIFTSLFAFSPQIVQQSRFAWNPNPLPFFTLLFLFSLKRVVLEKKEKFLLLLAFSIGAAIHLHYSGLAFLLILFLTFLFFRPKFKNRQAIAASFLILFVFFLPLLVFDLRHQFINSKNILKYFTFGTRGEIPPPPFLTGLWHKLVGLFGLVFVLPNAWVKILTIAFLTIIFFIIIKEARDKKTFFSLVFLTFLGGVLFSSLYRGSFFFFYLTFLYPLPFLIVALIFKKLFGKSRLALLILVLVSGLILKNATTDLFFSPLGEGKLRYLTKTARFLASKIKPEEKFNLVAIYKDEERYDHNAVDYRYFLEAYYGKKAFDWDVLDYQEAETVYLISEVGQAEPLSLDIWEVLLFGPEKVLATWDLGRDVVIYKLGKSSEF